MATTSPVTRDSLVTTHFSVTAFDQSVLLHNPAPVSPSIRREGSAPRDSPLLFNPGSTSEVLRSPRARLLGSSKGKTSPLDAGVLDDLLYSRGGRPGDGVSVGVHHPAAVGDWSGTHRQTKVEAAFTPLIHETATLGPPEPSATAPGSTSSSP